MKTGNPAAAALPARNGFGGGAVAGAGRGGADRSAVGVVRSVVIGCSFTARWTRPVGRWEPTRSGGSRARCLSALSRSGAEHVGEHGRQSDRAAQDVDVVVVALPPHQPLPAPS